MARKREFRVGDQVVFPEHGAGRIVGVCEREALGQRREYYEIRLSASDMKVLVPVATAREVGLRPVIDVEQVEEVLSALSDAKLELPGSWVRRRRLLEEKLATGDPVELAQVVSTLARRSESRELPPEERSMLAGARRILASELAVAQGLQEEAVLDQINSAVAGWETGGK